MTPAWLLAARTAAERPPEVPREALCARSRADGVTVIGSIEPALAERLRTAGLPLTRRVGETAEVGWVVGEPTGTGLDAIADWLLAKGVCGRRRDERLAVAAIAGAGAPLASIERGVVRALGIATVAVHLVGSTRGGEVWVQQRALDKATDPGSWDTLMGGQVAAGEGITDTLARETMEEAGLRIDALEAIRRVSPILIRRPVPEGYMVERVEVFTACVPDGVKPVNRDGEVVAFARLAREALVEQLAADAFTLEATLILGNFLEHAARLPLPLAGENAARLPLPLAGEGGGEGEGRRQAKTR